VTAGELYTLSLSVSDPGTDTISGWVIDWGDGTVDTIVGNPPTADHTYLQPKTLAGDFNSDGDVDGTDLVKFADNLGKTGVGLDGDFDGDGDVDNDDMAVFVPNFGKIGYDVYTISATATDEDGTYSANTWQVDVLEAPAQGSISQIGAPQTITSSAADSGLAAVGEFAVPQTVLEADGIAVTAPSEPAADPEANADSVPPKGNSAVVELLNQGDAKDQTPARDFFLDPKGSMPEQSDTNSGSEQSPDKTSTAQKQANHWMSLWPQRNSIWDQPHGSGSQIQLPQGDSEAHAGWENQFNTRRRSDVLVDLSGHFQDFKLSSKLFSDHSARPWIVRFVNDLAINDDEMNPNRGTKLNLSDSDDQKDTSHRRDKNSVKTNSAGSEFLSRKKLTKKNYSDL
jgi:hypothetical protein